MTSRAVGFVLTRPRIVLPGLIGLGLMLIGLPKVVGVILLAITAMRMARMFGYDDLEVRLRLREQKRAHGISRQLTPNECEEIIALDTYCAELRRGGTDLALIDETMSEGWEIIRRGGRGDQHEALRRFRTQLPDAEGTPIARDWQAPDLRARLERELHLIRASHREVELTAAS